VLLTTMWSAWLNVRTVAKVAGRGGLGGHYEKHSSVVLRGNVALRDCGAQNYSSQQTKCGARLNREYTTSHLVNRWDASGPLRPRRECMTQEEMIAAAIAHRGCCGLEHDPANGKLHGYCVVCGVPWPCDTAKRFMAAEHEPPAPNSAMPKLPADCAACPLRFICKGTSMHGGLACRGARSQLRAGA
jgi:hypothetical protein